MSSGVYKRTTRIQSFSGTTPKCASLLPQNRLCGRAVLHWKSCAANAVEREQRTGHGGRGRNEADFADTFCAVRAGGLVFLDEDAFNLGNVFGAEDAQRAQILAHDEAVLELQFLRQRVAEAHVD